MRKSLFSIALLVTLVSNPVQISSADQGPPSRRVLQDAMIVAYKTQMAKADQDCPNVQGQQPYNVCLGAASEQLEQDYKIFYDNLHTLVDPGQVKGLQDSEAPWREYRKIICDAAYAQFAGGTAAPGAQASCYLQVTRVHMETLYRVYGEALSR